MRTKQNHNDQVQLCIVTARSGSPQIMPCMSLVAEMVTTAIGSVNYQFSADLFPRVISPEQNIV